MFVDIAYNQPFRGRLILHLRHNIRNHLISRSLCLYYYKAENYYQVMSFLSIVGTDFIYWPVSKRHVPPTNLWLTADDYFIATKLGYASHHRNGHGHLCERRVWADFHRSAKMVKRARSLLFIDYWYFRPYFHWGDILAAAIPRIAGSLVISISSRFSTFSFTLGHALISFL